jgi:ADP-heptose:LPS heptosyltransferase
MRILFITATRLGDAVLSTGLIEHLRQVSPSARFTVACGPVAAGVFARMPGLDRVIVVDKRRFDLHWLYLWAQVVRTRWDLVVDLRGSALSLCVIAGRRAIMRGGRRPGHRLTHIAGALGLAAPVLPVAWTAPADRAVAASLLPGGGPIVGLGPSANWPGKVWPADRFVALFQALSARLPGARAAVFGGPDAADRVAGDRVLAALPEAVDLVGRLSLPEAAACLARCTIFVGNDSGLMHLAASAGAPTLGLFGPTPASEYAPAGRCSAVVLADGPPGRAPMTELPVQSAVLAAIELLLVDGRLGRISALLDSIS